ncbi:hypothetical protein [Szabonella alba]|uniref:Uncharacterized protein n=1 Tax=Szabonella alba TaxID=2804194 RepID=A0A8K0Y079_9RHOB|nr:hypothetical protein [Szabonella alba]MBL4916833.1 hypothetical protein [Szabonella alba]
MTTRPLQSLFATLFLTLVLALSGATPSADAFSGPAGQSASDARLQTAALAPVAHRLIAAALPDQSDDALPARRAVLPSQPGAGLFLPFIQSVPAALPGRGRPSARGPPVVAS